MFENARNVQRRHMANGEGGFTLIELLIVIVVLGILAAIVVFALGGVTGQSAVAACTADAKTVSIAVSAWDANNPNTAATAGQTGNLVTGSGDVNGQSYLKSWPSNPAYYKIDLAGGNVTVSLNASDPGATYTGAPVAPAYGTAENFEGTTPFAYPATTTPTTLELQGICAGA